MHKELTILHLVHQMSVGGAEKVIINLINGSNNKNKHVICSFYPVDRKFSELIREDKRTVICVNKKPGNDFSLPFRIARICRKYNVNIVHAQSWGTYVEGFLGAFLSLKMPAFIFAFRGKTIEDMDGVPARRRISQRLLAKFCSAIVTPSKQMACEYADSIGIGRDRIKVIYNGVRLDSFQPVDSKSEAKQFLNLPGDSLVIGCVARFDPIKNIKSLVHSFAELSKRYDLLHLVLVGDGECRDDLMALVSSLNIEDRVMFSGESTSVMRFYNAMDIYVLPSLYEGVSNTILEASSCALPVVAGRVGGTPEILFDNVNGILLDSLSVESLIDGLELLLSSADLRLEMGRAGREIVEEKFSMPSMVAEYEALFNHVATRRFSSRTLNQQYLDGEK
ncbi:glycosyltransferase [uncultured Desulfuromusa sp.]|uniref:glycosyltransferase n=1 Tax=uncultured Desulfuromusa sp. TaxID=219183 RepID=UPI002AA72BE8|nr:glycosyltransferase [uncultured Desulfuromusa sp.]